MWLGPPSKFPCLPKPSKQNQQSVHQDVISSAAMGIRSSRAHIRPCLIVRAAILSRGASGRPRGRTRCRRCKTRERETATNQRVATTKVHPSVACLGAVRGHKHSDGRMGSIRTFVMGSPPSAHFVRSGEGRSGHSSRSTKCQPSWHATWVPARLGHERPVTTAMPKKIPTASRFAGVGPPCT